MGKKQKTGSQRAIPPPTVEPFLVGLDIDRMPDRCEFWRRLCGGSDPHHEYSVMYTTEMAEWLLAEKRLLGVDRNHSDCRKHIREMRRKMRAGEWHDNAGTILYSRDGRLGAGYSQLHAIRSIPSYSVRILTIGPSSPERILASNVVQGESIPDRMGSEFGVPQRFQSPFSKVCRLISKHILGVERRVPNYREIQMLAHRFETVFLDLAPLTFGEFGATPEEKEQARRAFHKDFVEFRHPAVLAAFCLAHRDLKGTLVPDLLTRLLLRGAGSEAPAVTVEALARRPRARKISRRKSSVKEAETTLWYYISREKKKGTVAQLELMHRLIHGILAAIRGFTLIALSLKQAYRCDDPQWNAEYARAAGKALPAHASEKSEIDSEVR